jgi:hypothetical protein
MQGTTEEIASWELLATAYNLVRYSRPDIRLNQPIYGYDPSVSNIRTKTKQ